MSNFPEGSIFGISSGDIPIEARYEAYKVHENRNPYTIVGIPDEGDVYSLIGSAQKFYLINIKGNMFLNLMVQ